MKKNSKLQLSNKKCLSGKKFRPAKKRSKLWKESSIFVFIFSNGIFEVMINLKEYLKILELMKEVHQNQQYL
jgi:hypothetical protein